MKKHLAFTIIVLFLLIPKCKEASEPIEPILADNEEEITIASWNLKNFGQTKLNDSARIDVIVSVLRKYDIVAIQEVQDVSLALPTELIAKINASGENYQVVSSERVGRTRKEQYLFIYNDDVIDFIQGTTGYGIEPNDEFSREPFYAMFKAGNFDFYLMTIHTVPEEVAEEIPALKVAYLDLQENTPNEDDIILLGDFNAKAPGVTVGSYITMDAIADIPNIVFAINEATNTRGDKAYDNIVFQGNYTTEHTDESGVIAFWDDHGLTEDEGFSISDHRLVWVKFQINLKDDDPAEINAVTHALKKFPKSESLEAPSEELKDALETVISSKPFKDLKYKSGRFKGWQWLVICLAGMLGGLLYGMRDKQFILPHKEQGEKNSYRPGFLLDVFFGMAGGFVVYMVIPGDFDFSAGGFDAIKIIAVTLIGGYGGRALIERVYAEQVGKLERGLKDLQAKDKKDATAIALVNKHLDPDPDMLPVSNTELKTAILSSSAKARVEIFATAREFRKSMWEKERRDLLNKVVPIFEVLIECDTENKYHRNHGQLGYALKDKTDPNYQLAEEELSKAIEIRDKSKVQGFRSYEFNRVICKIFLKAPIDEIKSDLDKALLTLNPKLKDVIQNPCKIREKEYQNWLNANSAQLEEWIKQNNIHLDKTK